MRAPWQFVTGELLAPLSLRDVWLLRRATLFMTQLNKLYPELESAEPDDERYYRHVLDWLREPTDEGDKHWVHTERVDDNYLAEYGSEGTYPSDEDGYGSCMSDEDN